MGYFSNVMMTTSPIKLVKGKREGFTLTSNIIKKYKKIGSGRPLK